MFKLGWRVIKLTLFALIIVIVANLIQWKGITISDQIKLQMAKTEQAEVVSQVKAWTKQLTRDAREGVLERSKNSEETNQTSETFSPSEKEKLRSLLNDLNKKYLKN